MSKILLAGEDASLILTLRHELSEDGHDVRTARKQNSILRAVAEEAPDLVVVEIAEINARSIDLVRKIRQTPSVMASALVALSRGHEADEVASVLDAGADLFMARPIAMPELKARIRALLRRSGPLAVWENQIVMEINPTQRLVRIGDRTAQLTPVEYDLLAYMCASDEEYHPARHLLHEVWEYPPGAGDTALVRNHIRNLRAKLEEDPERPRILESMPKRGYRVNAEVRWAAHNGVSQQF